MAWQASVAMTPVETLDAADALVRPERGHTDGWPRLVAVLGRHSIEEALRQYWCLREPGLERCSGRAQLLCLTAYLSDRDLARDKLEAMTTVAFFADLPALAANILAGQVRGRTVIDINA